MNLEIQFYRTDQANSRAEAEIGGALYHISVANTGETSSPSFANTSSVSDALCHLLNVADCFDGGFSLRVFLVNKNTGAILDSRTYHDGRRTSMTVSELIEALRLCKPNARVYAYVGGEIGTMFQVANVDAVDDGRVDLNVLYPE